MIFAWSNGRDFGGIDAASLKADGKSDAYAIPTASAVLRNLVNYPDFASGNSNDSTQSAQPSQSIDSKHQIEL